MIGLVADLGGTRVKLALMRNGAVLAQHGFEARSHEGLAPQLPRIARSFESMCGDVGVARAECSAVAIAFPSLVDVTAGRILTSYGKYEDAPALDLVGWAREALGLPLVLENDARAALLGEWQAGAGRGSDDLVMVTLGTGLGTAALLQGRLLRGTHGQAGILGGHLTVRHGGRRCTCGNYGCAEAEASTSVLPRVASEHADFAGSALRHAGVIDYAQVLRLARQGDACAQALRAQAVEVWSALIVNLIHAYDPERVIVGGGIMAGAPDFFPEVTDRVHARAHTPWGRLQLVAAQLGDAAALHGCELLIRERCLGSR